MKARRSVAVWSAINEPMDGQVEAIEALLKAGARVEAAGYPTGKADVDRLLLPYIRT